MYAIRSHKALTRELPHIYIWFQTSSKPKGQYYQVKRNIVYIIIIISDRTKEVNILLVINFEEKFPTSLVFWMLRIGHRMLKNRTKILEWIILAITALKSK